LSGELRSGRGAQSGDLSVTEGEDKPLKYPDMFRAASLMLLNKCDLLPHLTSIPTLPLNTRAASIPNCK